MEQVKSTLQFRGYLIKQMMYKEFSQMSDSEHVDISPKFDYAISELGGGEYLLRQKVMIGDVKNESGLPFFIMVDLVGKFLLENVDDADKCMKTNAMAILYPYMRATVSFLTTTANIPSVIMPTINITKMVDAAMEKLNASDDCDTQ